MTPIPSWEGCGEETCREHLQSTPDLMQIMQIDNSCLFIAVEDSSSATTVPEPLIQWTHAKDGIVYDFASHLGSFDDDRTPC